MSQRGRGKKEERGSGEPPAGSSLLAQFKPCILMKLSLLCWFISGSNVIKVYIVLFYSGDEFIGDSDTDSDGLDMSPSFSHHLVNHKTTSRTSRSSTMSSDGGGGGGGGNTPHRHAHTSNGHDSSLQQSQGTDVFKY